jgi:hypothetical protein
MMTKRSDRIGGRAIPLDEPFARTARRDDSPYLII